MFRAAPLKSATGRNHVLLTWSEDEGRSWSEPVEPFAPPENAGRSGMLRVGALTPLGGRDLVATLCWVDHSQPDLPFFNERTEGVLDTLILLARSTDEGRSWSEPQFVDTSPFPKGSTCLTGPVLRLRDGSLGCHFEIDKAYDDASKWFQRAGMIISPDGGKTWAAHSVTAEDPAGRVFFWDQRPAVLPDGTLLNVFWTFDRETAAYLPIHAAESRDHGRSWSPAWNTQVPGQPARPACLDDGRVVLVYVDRTAAPTIKARVSTDRGRTWPADTELLLSVPAPASETVRKDSMQEAWSEMGKFSIGLPDAVACSPDEVVAVFYHGENADCTNIEWVRLAVT